MHSTTGQRLPVFRLRCAANKETSVHRGDLRLASHKDAGGDTDEILGRHRRARRALRPFLILNMEPLSRKVLVHCAPNSRGAYVACEAIRTYSERSLVEGVDGWNTGNGVLIPYCLTARFSQSRRPRWPCKIVATGKGRENTQFRVLFRDEWRSGFCC